MDGGRLRVKYGPKRAANEYHSYLVGGAGRFRDVSRDRRLGFALLPWLSPPDEAAAAEAKSGAGLNPGTPWEKAEND